MNTRDELGIFWPTDDGHVEMPGVECYGFFRNSPDAFNDSSVADLWLAETAKIKITRIRYDEGTVVVILIGIIDWPSELEWMRRLEQTLAAMIASGACIAWAGGYDCSSCLDVLDPKSSEGNVYAAYTKQTSMICNSTLLDPLVFLTDQQLLELKQSVPEMRRQLPPYADNGF